MSSLAGCNDQQKLAALGVLRDDHYPSLNIVKWHSSDLIGSLKSRLAITKMTRILPLVTRLSLPLGGKRGGARD